MFSFLTRKSLTAFLISAAVLLVVWNTPAESSKPAASLAAAGFDGSAGTMQSVALPARVHRLARVPGSSHLWAIGHITSAQPGWAENQLVFLRYDGRSWRVYGPPKTTDGQLANPTLFDLKMASEDEGWAVGTEGTLVHFTAGEWVVEPQCGSSGPLGPGSACADLKAITLRNGAGYVVGSARDAGAGARTSTVLTLKSGHWELDPRPVVSQSGAVDLNAVVAISDEDAWAIGGSGSRELQLFRRSPVGWTRIATGKPIFDNPAPSNDGRTVNLTAIGYTASATSDGRSVWFGGGIYPVNPTQPLEPADEPFTMQWRGTPGDFSNNGTFTSYCAPQYNISGDTFNTSDICDRRMPLSRIDITSFSVLGSGDDPEVFAGGLGLYHFRNDVWWREPDTINYLSSVAFSSASDGWVASAGDAFGGGDITGSSENALGHYSASAETSHIARWPQYNTNLLQSIAIAPDGGRALAVGNEGTSMIYVPSVGWDQSPRVAAYSLHAVAWSGPNEAWAVGEKGIIEKFDGKKFVAEQVGTASDGNALMGVAFRSGRGFAVGANGTIISLQQGNWRADPASHDLKGTLYAISALGNGFVAVGDASTVLTNPSGTPGDWHKEDVSGIIADSQPLYAVKALSDGTVLVGGGKKALLVKEPGGGFRAVAGPLDLRGSVVAIDGLRSPNGLKIFASISPLSSGDYPKYLQEKPKLLRTELMYFDGSVWKDLQMSSRRTVFYGGRRSTRDNGSTTNGLLDTAALRDPIFAIATDAAGTKGWAVGGSPERVIDPSDQHFNSAETSSIYRIDLNGDPSAPNSTAAPNLPTRGFNFAFFSDSSCGIGPCSMTVGSSTTADEVALRIRDEISNLAAIRGGPAFVIHGGNGRWTGIPEEMEQFKGYLSDFTVPVFGALGPNDLLTPAAAGGIAELVPEVPDNLRVIVDPPDAKRTFGTNKFALRAFKDQCAPWGDQAGCTGISPIDIGVQPDRSLARTHYAFDYSPYGKSLARFVILDTSDRTYSKAGQAVSTQNPSEDQALWFPQVATDASTKNIPTIVVMNVPTTNPTSSIQPDRRGMLADAPTFESQAVASGVSAVFTGLIHSNGSYTYPADVPTAIPFYVLGTGGAPLNGTKYPEDGNFHAWHLVNVDPSNVSLVNRQATVRVKSFPVVESVALHAIDGLSAPGGTPLHFTALARAVDGGGPASDHDQIRRTYISFPWFHTGDNEPRPDYHFTSDDPSIAQFVTQGLPGLPLVRDNFLLADDQSGFLCTFKAGKTFVNITTGTHRMRMPITVGPGFGTCVEHPVLSPTETQQKRLEPSIATPPGVPTAINPHLPILHHLLVPDPLALVLPPAPGPIAAPAPPGSAATSRKEEEEHQTQSEGQEGDGADAVVMLHARRIRSVDPVFLWLMLASMTVLAGLGGVATGQAKKRKIPDRNYVRVRIF